MKIGIMRGSSIRVLVMLRKLIQASVIVVLSSGAAYAQLTTGNTGAVAPTGGMMIDDRRQLSPEDQRREREIEAEYNRTIHDRIPDKKSSSDPWGNIRSAPAKK